MDWADEDGGGSDSGGHRVGRAFATAREFAVRRELSLVGRSDEPRSLASSVHQFADALSPSLLEHLIKAEGSSAE